MIYFGLRSSRGYLELLQTVNACSEPHDIVSVIGGTAFLQAIGPNCHSLIALDTDCDAVVHARLIIALIRASDSLKHFLSYLSSHQVLSLEKTCAHFGDQIDHVTVLASKLNDIELLNLYASTYAAIKLDPVSGSGKIGDSTIHFFGHNLAPMHFNWNFGSGAFESEERFQILRKIIGAIPFELRLESLDQFNYGAANAQRQGQLFVLASNCDSPLFTCADRILKRIQQTTLCRTRYLSWNRDLEIIPSNQPYYDLVGKLSRICRGHALYSVGKCGVDAPKETLAASSFVDYVSWTALVEQRPYNFDTLLVWLAPQGHQEFVDNCSQYAAPCFRRIVMVASGPAEPLIAESQELTASYMIETIEWFASGVIVVWGLRGAFVGIGK